MAGYNDEKLRQMQDEMSRFEEEIGLPLPDVVPLPPDKRGEDLRPPPAPPGALIPPPLPSLPPPPPMGMMPHGALPPGGPLPPGHMIPGPMPHGAMSGCPPGPLPPGPPMPHPAMINAGPRGMGPPMMPPGMLPPGPPLLPGPPGPPMFNPGPPPMMPQPLPPSMGPPLPLPPMPPQFSSQFPNNVGPPIRPPEKAPGPIVLSSNPMLYVSTPQIDIGTVQTAEPISSNRMTEPAIDIAMQDNKKKKLEKPVITVTTEPVASQTQSKKKEKKNRKLMRTAGGHTWEDHTLGEWDDDDFRLFCGDLGNDVTDEVLSRAFSKYVSFSKAKVIRDKRTNKTKGFGFVSFKDPQDFIKATKEMNGRYVGSRPIKLRKSTWKNRSLDVVRKKDKEKVALINMLTGK